MEWNYKNEPGRTIDNRGLVEEVEPLVSIITPFYNSGKHFEQTYNCIMNQTFPWFEWIIVNDGSTNDEDIINLEKLVNKKSRIKLYHTENKGVAAARNYAVSKASTEIIVPIDSDDLVTPTYVEYLYWGLYFNPKASWAYTNSIGFGNQEYLWKKTFDSDRMKVSNFLTNSAAIRKDIFLRVGGYESSINLLHEDWELWLKLMGENAFPVHINDYCFWYRRNESSRFSLVEGVLEKKHRNNANDIIKKRIEKIKGTIKAVEYPVYSDLNRYKKPQKSKWDRKVFKKHDKINVCMLLPWLEMGGADLFNLDIVRRMDKNEFEFSVLTTVNGDNSWKQKFQEHVSDLFELPSFLNIEDYPEFISYFIQSREIDVLFLSNSYYGYYLVPWLRKEFPELAIIDYVHMEEWYWRNGGYARTSGVVGNILDKTYVCNEHTREVMIHNFAREQDSVETLYIGVDKEQFREDIIEAGEIRKKFSIDENRPVILFPCRMHAQKRPFLMLDIVKALLKELPDLAVLLVGDGPLLPEIKAKIHEKELSDVIYITGAVDDMRPYYRDSNLTLICSLKEGLALTAYESCSMATPVVTSDVGGQAELIDQTVGAVIPLYQAEEDLEIRNYDNEEIERYVEEIVKIIKDKQLFESMCINCRKKVEEGFSVQIMIQKLDTILKDLVNNDLKKQLRVKQSQLLNSLGCFADDYVTLYTEIEAFESAYKGQFASNEKNELLRLANSRLGKRIIRLGFKLKLNKLFR